MEHETGIPVKGSEKLSYGTSLWMEAFKRLLGNKASIAGIVILLLFVLAAIFANQIAPYSFDEQNTALRFISPFTRGHFLGTDSLGRDIFSRIIYGARYSLSVGIVSVAIAAVLGSLLGIVSGFYSTLVDNIIMRFMDILLAIPPILLAICIAATLGTGLMNLMIAVGISTVPGYARIARASVMGTKEQEFIEAARATGANNFRIITKYILPNITAPLIVQATIGVANAILSAAALSFLGLGIEPPKPEWGTMLSMGRQYITSHPYLCLYPGIAIALTILSLNMLGDGLRDALDPKLKQ